MYDCNGLCAPVDWLGDGYCDDGTTSSVENFNCAALNYDDGDCNGTALQTGDTGATDTATSVP